MFKKKYTLSFIYMLIFKDTILFILKEDLLLGQIEYIIKHGESYIERKSP